jgi:hypothetical protein
MLAWLAQRNRYSLDQRTERVLKMPDRRRSLTLCVEAPDWREAEQAVREIMTTREGRPRELHPRA